ncbi:MAG: hypothetical protein ACPG31_04605 [Planctomycetota bacterium]
MLLSTLLLFCAVPMQDPPPALQRAFQADQVHVRHDAARSLAVGDERAEAWLLQEVRKGTEERQRALLLAAALMGTPDCLEVVERAARKGRKPEPLRAFALLLYGSLHPAAGEDAAKDWERCSSEFERSCLLAGLLTQPQRILVDPLPELIRKRKEEGPLALLRLAEALPGNGYPPGTTLADRAASLLLSVDPRRSLLELELGEDRYEFPALWSETRRQEPPRSLEQMSRRTLVGDRIGSVLALFEIEVDARQALFDHYAPRAVGDLESLWLWGAAGDLGLSLPAPGKEEQLRLCHVVGALRLYRRDRARGLIFARSYLDLARADFADDRPLQNRWGSTLLLAMVAEEQDVLALKEAYAVVDPVLTYRFAPAWQFANRRLGSADLVDHWLDTWSRDLDSGWQGYLDREGPRWVGYLLTGGSLAAKNHDLLSTRHKGLEIVSKDYALDHVVYRDIVEFLMDGDYRWSDDNR